MPTQPFWSRRPLSTLGRLTVIALLVTTLAYAAELFSLGLDPEVTAVVAVLALATGLAASGRPLTPALGALVAGLILANNPFLLFNLSNPGNLAFFVAAIIQASATLLAIAAGIGASVQHVRRRRATPPEQ